MATYQHVCKWCGKGFKTRRQTSKTCNVSCRGALGGSRSLKGTRAERFWSRVDRRGSEECWPWKNKVNDAGYGIFNDQTLASRAHRVSWELAFGPIPDDLRVRHKCDNPPCVNPAHLELGTHKQNMEDMVQRGRGKSGTSECGKGHDITDPTSFRLTAHRGYMERVCLKCNRERQNRYLVRRRSKLTPGLS